MTYEYEVRGLTKRIKDGRSTVTQEKFTTEWQSPFWRPLCERLSHNIGSTIRSCQTVLYNSSPVIFARLPMGVMNREIPHHTRACRESKRSSVRKQQAKGAEERGTGAKLLLYETCMLDTRYQ